MVVDLLDLLYGFLGTHLEGGDLLDLRYGLVDIPLIVVDLVGIDSPDSRHALSHSDFPTPQQSYP